MNNERPYEIQFWNDKDEREVCYGRTNDLAMAKDVGKELSKSLQGHVTVKRNGGIVVSFWLGEDDVQ